MGGFGSGRHGGKPKLEGIRSLNVNAFNKFGCFAGEFSGGWEWKEDDQVIADIRFEASRTRLVLRYNFRRHGGDWESIVQPINLTWQECRFGGERPYFLCPGVVNGVHCNKRVIKLYGAGRFFLCRHCYNLAYSSQSETRYDRLLRRANKRRMALGGEPGVCSIIVKPKGMWQRTFEKHKSEILWHEHLATSELLRTLGSKPYGQELIDYLEI